MDIQIICANLQKATSVYNDQRKEGRNENNKKK